MLSDTDVSSLCHVDASEWLSLYVCQDEPGPARLRAQGAVDDLAARLRLNGQEGAAERVRAAAQASHQLIDQVAAGPDSGALFLCLADGTHKIASVDGTIRELAYLGERPCVAPLLEAAQRLREAGVAVADMHHVRVSALRGEHLIECMAAERVSLMDEQPARPRGHVRPLSERVQAEQDRQWLDHVAAQLCDYVRRAGWDELVVAAPPSILARVSERCASQVEIVELAANLDHSPDLPRLAWEHLRAHRQQRAARMVERMTDGPELVARGEHDVHQQLLAGRVATLVVAAQSNDELPGAEKREEYHGIERLVHEALATQAKVIVLDGDAGSSLLERDSVAARLRW
jgi:hypothetical protein